MAYPKSFVISCTLHTIEPQGQSHESYLIKMYTLSNFIFSESHVSKLNIFSRKMPTFKIHSNKTFFVPPEKFGRLMRALKKIDNIVSAPHLSRKIFYVKQFLLDAGIF